MKLLQGDVAASPKRTLAYLQLKSYPQPEYFYNIYTHKTVLAQRWECNTKVKVFFVGKKYCNNSSGKSSFYGIRSQIISIRDFNNRFVLCASVDMTNPHIKALSEKKTCKLCGAKRYGIEFTHNTHKQNTRSDVCIICAQKGRRSANVNMEVIDRATKEGFITYMTARPVCFESVFSKSATLDNILYEYRELFTRQSCECD